MRVRSLVGGSLVLLALLLGVPATADVKDVQPVPTHFQSLAAAGSDAVCGIRVDTTLQCWGRKVVAVSEPPPGSFTAVSAARRVACGLRSDASMTCWGRWWADVGPGSTARAPAGSFLAVDLAEVQGCAIRSDRGLACFGRGDPDGGAPAGALADGEFVDVAAVHDRFGGCAIRVGGRIACWGDDAHGQASPPEGTFVDIAAGRWTYCAIRESGEIACWGLGLYGAGDPPPGRFTSLAIGGDTGCAIRAGDGTVACWGADLGPPPAAPVAAVAIGDTIAAAIRADGTIDAWGDTRYWPAWGYEEPPAAAAFGVFRIVGSLPRELAAGRPVDAWLSTTSVHPAPRFRVTDGALPPGIDLTAGGRLHGIPGVPGRYGPVTVEADNGIAPPASMTFRLDVRPAARAAVRTATCAQPVAWESASTITNAAPAATVVDC